jgi:hypothetical protein
MSIITFVPQPQEVDSTLSFFAHDPYIERFWQPFIGPSATVLLNILSTQPHMGHEPFSFTREELSLRIGTGNRSGNSSPVVKQLNRLHQFKLIEQVQPELFSVHSHIGLLSPHLITRLSTHDRIFHEMWIQQLVEHPGRTQKRRAHHLVTTLAMMGYHDSVIEGAIERSGLHPSVIGEIIASLSASDVA